MKLEFKFERIDENLKEYFISIIMKVYSKVLGSHEDHFITERYQQRKNVTITKDFTSKKNMLFSDILNPYDDQSDFYKRLLNKLPIEYEAYFFSNKPKNSILVINYKIKGEDDPFIMIHIRFEIINIIINDSLYMINVDPELSFIFTKEPCNDRISTVRNSFQKIPNTIRPSEFIKNYLKENEWRYRWRLNVDSKQRIIIL